jgi:hypothetical protein
MEEYLDKRKEFGQEDPTPRQAVRDIIDKYLPAAADYKKNFMNILMTPQSRTPIKKFYILTV